MKQTYVQLGLAIVIFLVGFGMYMFLYTDVQTESAKAARLVAETKEKSQASNRIEQAKEHIAVLAPQEKSINQYLVSPADIVPFLDQFTKTGDYLGSHVEVVSVSAAPGAPYGTVSLSLKISGSFEAVMRTLGSIEYGPYGITTNSLTLAVSPQSSGSSAITPHWTAALILTIGTQ